MCAWNFAAARLRLEVVFDAPRCRHRRWSVPSRRSRRSNTRAAAESGVQSDCFCAVRSLASMAEPACDEPHGRPADVDPRSPCMNHAMSDAAVLIIDDDANLRDLGWWLNRRTSMWWSRHVHRRNRRVPCNRDRVCLVLLDYFMPGMDAACRASCAAWQAPRHRAVHGRVNPAARAAEVGLPASR